MPLLHNRRRILIEATYKLQVVKHAALGMSGRFCGSHESREHTQVFYNKTVTLTRLGQLKPTFEGNTTGISIFLASFAGGELIAYVQVKMLVNGLDIPMAP